MKKIIALLILPFFSFGAYAGNISITQAETISSYDINGDELTFNNDSEELPDHYKVLQNDKEKHKKIWEIFTKIIPAKNRALLSGFEIFTDGKDGTLAAVGLNQRNIKKLILYIDILDSYDGENINYLEVVYALIHEFAHVLTLNYTQINPVIIKTVKEYEYRKKQCYPNYFEEEGCSYANSYINLFFKKFWRNIYGEWERIMLIQDETLYNQEMGKFYEKYKEQFIDDYAATHPAEDIAESFTAFIFLQEKPTGNSIIEKKIRFFYGFKELVKLRNEILQK